MLRNPILLAIILATGQTLSAKTLSFPEYGFSIDLPSTWHAVDPPPAHTACSIQTADGLKGLVLMSSHFSKDKLPTALEDMANGIKEAAKAKGCKIQNERELTISGMPTRAFTTQISDTVSIVSYMGLADDVGYSLQGFSKTSDAGTDTDITAVVNTFRLLPKAESPQKPERSDDTAYRFGHVVGRGAMILFVLGLFWILLSKPGGKKKLSNRDCAPDDR